MAIKRNQILNNIIKVPTLKNKKIVIIGLSEDCFLTAEILHELKYELYAYASDDFAAVTRINKNSVIFAEKWFAGDMSDVIRVITFDEIFSISNAIYFVASKHYEGKLKEKGYTKNIDFFRINEVTK
jgi:hypothetical protein